MRSYTNRGIIIGPNSYYTIPRDKALATPMKQWKYGPFYFWQGEDIFESPAKRPRDDLSWSKGSLVKVTLTVDINLKSLVSLAKIVFNDYIVWNPSSGIGASEAAHRSYTIPNDKLINGGMNVVWIYHNASTFPGVSNGNVLVSLTYILELPEGESPPDSPEQVTPKKWDIEGYIKWGAIGVGVIVVTYAAVKIIGLATMKRVAEKGVGRVRRTIQEWVGD